MDIAVDVMLPADRLAMVLREFAAMFPTVAMRLHVEALGAVTAAVLEQKASIGISGTLAAGVEGVECIALGSVAMVPVAAPHHPLGRLERIAPGEACNHVQLVLTDRSHFTEGEDFAVLSLRTWRLDRFAALGGGAGNEARVVAKQLRRDGLGRERHLGLVVDEDERVIRRGKKRLARGRGCSDAHNRSPAE
ncbi:hypothetical protein FHS82_003544 [Pseudochelatococcus lubricantis]|uniref:LysR substrate-binding domain-containing protein n=1 Tax=Pseudochelatococcus lubricantis TaxID=1538102 RepID=A0ABX0V524_9HYPH|nr:hypothetical protein [Pseudochelatococcus lubricantis]